MSQSNVDLYGKPIAASNGVKGAVEIYDAAHGKYVEPVLNPSGSNPSEKLNPKPFTLK